jgi:hypothetical protein
MENKHNDYCHDIPHGRRGCYCWEGDRQQLLEMRIENMEKKMDTGTMKNYIDDLIIKVNIACKAMEEAEIHIAGLRIEVEHWKTKYEEAIRD